MDIYCKFAVSVTLSVPPRGTISALPILMHSVPPVEVLVTSYTTKMVLQFPQNLTVSTPGYLEFKFDAQKKRFLHSTVQRNLALKLEPEKFNLRRRQKMFL